MARPPETPARTRGLELRGGRRGNVLPELRGVDTVLLHLQVQGLVVGAEEPRRLALVSSRGLKGQTDCVPLGVRRGRLRDLTLTGSENASHVAFPSIRLFAMKDRDMTRDPKRAPRHSPGLRASCCES